MIIQVEIVKEEANSCSLAVVLKLEPLGLLNGFFLENMYRDNPGKIFQFTTFWVVIEILK